MALVRKLEKKPSRGYRVHGETACAYKVFEHAGEIYMQINTFGSEFRPDRTHPSQTLQFGPEALSQLQEILKREVFEDRAPTNTSKRFGIPRWR